MTRNEIKDIRATLRGLLDMLDDLDNVPRWGTTDTTTAIDILADIDYYTGRQEMYYQQYRNLSE
jgi:hypothetical protein